MMICETLVITAIATKLGKPIFASLALAVPANVFFGNYQRPSTRFDNALSTFVGATCGVTLTYLSLLLVFQKTASERALLKYESLIVKATASARDVFEAIADTDGAAKEGTGAADKAACGEKDVAAVAQSSKKAEAQNLSERLFDLILNSSGAIEAIRKDAVMARGEQRLRWLPLVSPRFRVYLPVLRLPTKLGPLRLPKWLGGRPLLGLAGGDVRLPAALHALHAANLRHTLKISYIATACRFERGALMHAASCEGDAGRETLEELREAIVGGLTAACQVMTGVVHHRRSGQAERAIEELRACVARGERALRVRTGLGEDGGTESGSDGGVAVDAGTEGGGEESLPTEREGASVAVAEDDDLVKERQLLWATAVVSLHYQLTLLRQMADALSDLREWDLHAASSSPVEPPASRATAGSGDGRGAAARANGGAAAAGGNNADGQAASERNEPALLSVAERTAAALGGLAHEWAFPLKRGCRTAIATVVPVAVGFSYMEENADVYSACQTAVITIAILHPTQTVGTLVNKSVARIIGTLFACFFAYGVLQKRNDVWFVWWQVRLCEQGVPTYPYKLKTLVLTCPSLQTFWIALCLTLGSHIPYPYAGIVAAFTFVIIGYPSESSQTVSILTKAVSRGAGVFSGIGIMAIVVLLFFQEASTEEAWPALRLATQRIAATVRQAAGGARTDTVHRVKARQLDPAEISITLGAVKACVAAAKMGAMERLLFRRGKQTFYMTHIPVYAYLSHLPLVGAHVDPTFGGRMWHDGVLPYAAIEACLRGLLRALDAAAALLALNAHAADLDAGCMDDRGAAARVGEALDAILGEVVRVATVGGCAASDRGQLHLCVVSNAQMETAAALAAPARAKAIAALEGARQSLKEAESDAVRQAASSSAAAPGGVDACADVVRARIWAWRLLLEALMHMVAAVDALAQATP